jgi:hypothetical protein
MLRHPPCDLGAEGASAVLTVFACRNLDSRAHKQGKCESARPPAKGFFGGTRLFDDLLGSASLSFHGQVLARKKYTLIHHLT